ncbi:MAG: hypothetical protein JSU95_03340 [Betaproteobacteria bacterium]|nr:MAG: hypothetical protein JSU95_03340 [Betaproteobacteria bacterium]
MGRWQIRQGTSFGFSKMSFTTRWISMALSARATITLHAKEYEASRLCAIVGLTDISRSAERRHWLSDTVAASLLCWGVGTFMWKLNRERGEDGDGDAEIGACDEDVLAASAAAVTSDEKRRIDLNPRFLSCFWRVSAPVQRHLLSLVRHPD